MGRPIADDDELLEFPDELAGNEEELGLDDADELALSDIEDGPEEVGLDVDTLGNAALDDPDFDDEDDEDGDFESDDSLELGSDLDDEDDEDDGWIQESEGAGEAFEDDDLPDDDADGALDDDGGLEGVDDPEVDGIAEDEETSLTIGGDDDEGTDDEELGRLEIDIG